MENSLYIETLILKDKLTRLTRKCIELGWTDKTDQFDAVVELLVGAEIALDNIVSELGE